MKHRASLQTLARPVNFLPTCSTEPAKVPTSSISIDAPLGKRVKQAITMAILALVLLMLPLLANEAQAQSITHQVSYGESVSIIAARYGISANALASANGIYNVNLIRVGQVLVIPGATQPYQAAYSAPAPTNPVYIPAAPVYSGCAGYVVRAGDTLYAVARRYGVDISIIRQYNGLYSDMIRIGQCLVIPSGTPSAPAPDPRRASEQP